MEGIFFSLKVLFFSIEFYAQSSYRTAIFLEGYEATLEPMDRKGKMRNENDNGLKRGNDSMR